MAQPNRDRIRYNVFIGRARLEGLRMIQERDGIPPAEQIRRGIDRWLAAKGVKRAESKRAVSSGGGAQSWGSIQHEGGKNERHTLAGGALFHRG